MDSFVAAESDAAIPAVISFHGRWSATMEDFCSRSE